MFERSAVLGKTFSTVSSFSSTVDEFFFWVDKDSKPEFLEPGVVVSIPIDSDICFAQVVGISENMDYSNPLEAFASHNFGNAKYESKTDRFVCQAVRCKILRWKSGAVKPVSGERTVYLASKDGFKFAFGFSDGVPIGFSTTPTGNINFQSCLVTLPDQYLFGKEAQGINIGGQTGYAKTNLALNVALLSLKFLDDFCVIGVNVNGEDLLWLDKINPELSKEDLLLWKELGFSNLSWLNFVLFAPAGISLRSDGVETTFKLSWMDIKDELNLLFSESKDDENARFLLYHLASIPEVQSFSDAVNMLLEWEDAADRNKIVPGRHHPSTIKKVLKILKNLSSQPFINESFKKRAFPDLASVIKPKCFITFDLNDVLLSSNAQSIIFQKLLTEVRFLLENNLLFEKTRVKRVLIFVDELSKYAHRGLSTENFLSGVKYGVKNIAERGRFAGLSLLGVEQYPSQIDESVLQNMATRFFTRLKSKELSSELYKFYASDYVKAVSRLNKGIALLDHDTFPEAFFIRFPRSFCATSKPPEKRDVKKVVVGVE